MCLFSKIQTCHPLLSTYMSEATNVVLGNAVKDIAVFETYGYDVSCFMIREIHALGQVVRAQCNSRETCRREGGKFSELCSF